jgi:hypothetical protein
MSHVLLVTMAYDIDFAVAADYKFHVKSFFLYPKFWVANSSTITFATHWKRVRFTAANQKKVSTKKGVYAFFVQTDFPHLAESRYLFYIGKTNRELCTRYGEYLDDLAGKGKPRVKVFTMMKMYQKNLYFYYTELATSKEVNDLENCLLNTFVPHVNTLIPQARIEPELRAIYER